ncbi:MAG: triose-phosphate isomerase [Candidatus Micrarchaeota archaeon]
MKPLILLNFKSYSESVFPKSVSLVKAVEGVSEEFDVACCPESPELLFLREKFPKSLFFSQNCYSTDFGAFTGHFGIKQLKALGTNGSLINHSERKEELDDLSRIIVEAKEEKFKLVVCVDSLKEAMHLVAFEPWAMAFEPPELIGSGNSVSSSQPDVVKKFISLLAVEAPSILPFVGAGVSSRDDLRTSLSLGAKGVLVSSAFVKSTNPRKWFKDFVSK